MLWLGVDPFGEYPDGYEDAVSGRKRKKHYTITKDKVSWDEMHAKALELQIKYDFYKIIRKTSEEASKLIDNGSFDMGFIDGDHRKHYVEIDISCWLPKIRKGGVIAGDDVISGGVKSAVENIFGSDYNRHGRIWWRVVE